VLDPLVASAGQTREKRALDSCKQMKQKFTLAHLAFFLWAGASPLFGQAISSFDPSIGSSGDQIIINGSGFSPGTAVKFYNNVSASNPLPNANGTQITVRIPNGVTIGSHPIMVTVNATTVSSAEDFTVIGPGPYVTGFSPAFAAVSEPVIITGYHLTNAPSTYPVVKFNGVSCTSVLPNAGGTQINVNVPAGATTGLITVATASGGPSNSPSIFTVIGPGPYATDFTPIGSAGALVTIHGVHFLTASGVSFNGLLGQSFNPSDNQIMVNAPAGVTTGPLTILSSQGNFTTISNFFVPPVITTFSPSTGRAGTNVTLTGTNFLGATAVTVAGVAASIISGTNTSMLVSIPAGASSGPIRINTPAGSFTTTSNFKIQPVITSFSPGFGSPGTQVTVFGANLNEGLSAVLFNNVPASFSTPAYGQVVVTVPSAATIGPITVTTTNGSFTSSGVFYLPATITSFTPNTITQGKNITITGLNFLGTTAVSFNGAPASSFTVSNNTTIGAVAPDGVSTGPITVTTPAGTFSSSALFYAVPVITGFTPTHGLPGTSVTIFGTNFLGTTAVRFNGTPATINSVLNGQIVVTVPVGAATGPISVVAPAGTASSAANFVLDYTANLAVLVVAAPDPVTVGSNLVYTITVTNMGPYSAPNVSLTNLLPASVSLESSTTTQGSLVAIGNPILGSLGNLAVNGSATVSLTVRPSVPGTITNVTSIASDSADPALANNSVTTRTTVLPLALLSIQTASSNLVQVSWPVLLTNYVLQFNPDLATNSGWSNVIAVPVVSTNQNVVTETNTGSQRFYRLRK
jgi:uncharacterized repeat protein (TIGR01451 family)